MLTKSNGILLSTTNYSDNSVIAKILTEDNGVLGFLINGVRNRKGAIKPSHLQTLNLVELDYYFKPSSTLHRIKELRVHPPLLQSRQSIVQNTMLLFFSEILSKITNDVSFNDSIYPFVRDSILEIEQSTERHLAAYPSYFIMQLCKRLGHYPPTHFNPLTPIFHIERNEFLTQRETSVYTTNNLEQTKQFLGLLDQDYDTICALKWKKDTRVAILELSIHYLAINILNGAKIKSYAVLRQLF